MFSLVDLKVEFLDEVLVQLVVRLQPALQGAPGSVRDVGHLAGDAGILLQISTRGQFLCLSQLLQLTSRRRDPSRGVELVTLNSHQSTRQS